MQGRPSRAGALGLQSGDVAAPAAAALLSPWLDLTLSHAPLGARAASDPLAARDGLAAVASHYLAGADPRDPRASPLFGDLHDLPPILRQEGAMRRS